MSDLLACEPRTVLSLRQAVVNAFTALLAKPDSTLLSPVRNTMSFTSSLLGSNAQLPGADAALAGSRHSAAEDESGSEPQTPPSGALAAAFTSMKLDSDDAANAFAHAIRFVGRQALRAPPAALPQAFALDCAQQLCTPWAQQDNPRERRALLQAFVAAVDLSGADSAARSDDPEAVATGAVGAVEHSLLSAQMFEAAALLQRRQDRHAEALRTQLRHLQALAEVLHQVCKLGDSAADLPSAASDSAALASAPAQFAARRQTLLARAELLADMPSHVPASAADSGLPEALAQDQGALQRALCSMLSAWFDAAEPLMHESPPSTEASAPGTELQQNKAGDGRGSAKSLFLEHFASLLEIEDMLPQRSSKGSNELMCALHSLTDVRSFCSTSALLHDCG